MIRFGIVGAGAIARKFAQDIKLAQNAVLVAIASRSLEKANQFADEFSIRERYGSYEDLAKSKEVDAIYIATPHNFHFEQASLMLSHYKHVLCEKPITVNRGELEQLLALANQNKVLVMEAFWTRFLPAVQRVKQIIKTNELGALKHASFAFGFEVAEDYPDDGRLLNPDLAGGSILDLGIYPVSVLRYFVNSEIKEIEVDAALSDRGIDLDMNAAFTFQNGITAECRSSLSQDLTENGVLEFENGQVVMKNFHHCQQLVINDEVFDYPAKGDGFVHEIESFSDTLIKGQLENKIMTHDVMLDVIGILDDIRQKAGVIYSFEKEE
jgi:predicted dehydrogenase